MATKPLLLPKTYTLIWLDANVNNSKENLKAQQQLRSIISCLFTFDNDERCLEYISSSSKDARIILITSGSFGRNIVPQIVSLSQIIAIYIYCMDKKANKQWSQQFSKVCHLGFTVNKCFFVLRNSGERCCCSIR